MIMTDQDQDGSHIKGLVINFIHHNWPSLLKLPFMEEFITPIVKVTKGNQAVCFYSLPEFVEWKEARELGNLENKILQRFGNFNLQGGEGVLLRHGEAQDQVQLQRGRSTPSPPLRLKFPNL